MLWLLDVITMQLLYFDFPFLWIIVEFVCELFGFLTGTGLGLAGRKMMYSSIIQIHFSFVTQVWIVWSHISFILQMLIFFQ